MDFWFSPQITYQDGIAQYKKLGHRSSLKDPDAKILRDARICDNKNLCLTIIDRKKVNPNQVKTFRTWNAMQDPFPDLQIGVKNRIWIGNTVRIQIWIEFASYLNEQVAKQSLGHCQIIDFKMGFEHYEQCVFYAEFVNYLRIYEFTEVTVFWHRKVGSPDQLRFIMDPDPWGRKHSGPTIFHNDFMWVSRKTW